MKRLSGFFLLVLCMLLLSSKSATEIKLDKLIFHTSSCDGYCPIYNLELKDDGTFRLHAEEVYTYSKYDGTLMDSSRMGYFTGKVVDSTMQNIHHELETIGLDSLEFDNTICCDDPVVNLIIYYNGKRKSFTSIYPPQRSMKLVRCLYAVCKQPGMEKADSFFIEGPGK